MTKHTVRRAAVQIASNAERQAAYRKRHLHGAGDSKRLNVVISTDAKEALERLAKRHGFKIRDMIERLIFEADNSSRR